MKKQGRGEADPQRASWKQIWPYALLSLVALVFAFVLLVLLIWHADKIVALGLTGRLYYLLLLMFGLCASTILFGVLRSTAMYQGHVFGGWLRITGPAVGCFLIVILGFALPEPTQNFSMTIIAHGPKGNADLVLRSSGSIILDTGGLRRTARIGLNGDAVFLEIPANMHGQKVSLGLDAEGFELAEPQSELTLSPTTFYVEVHQKPGRLAGRVKDTNGQPLPGVTLTVGKIRTTTDDQGYFEMPVTGEEVDQNLTLVATKPGYKTWTGLEVTNSNEITISLDEEK